MILNGGMVTLGSKVMKPGPCRPINNLNISCCSHHWAFSKSKVLCGASREFDPLRARGWATTCLSSESSSLLRGDHDKLASMVPVSHKLYTAQPRSRMVPRASKDVPSSSRYPTMTKKPKWWWRVLAFLPYLMPLHETWMYAQTAYNLHPFLEDFEFLTYPFLGFLGSFPVWYLIAYFFAAYLGVVRRKEWPHFFRFHVITGMLLEIALQIIGTLSHWLPLGLYMGKVGIHFWTAVAFAHMFTVLECMKCALGGMYADIPFVCDAAYIQMPYD